MKTKISVAFLVLSLFLTAVPFSFAQTAPTDWNAVRRLSTGTNLFVKTSDGKTLSGSLGNVGEDRIELTVKGRVSGLPKNNIEAIYLAVPKSGKRGRIFGAIIGAFAGGFVGGAINRNADYESDYNYSAPLLLFFTGLAGGAFVGGRIGKGVKKGALIYIAR